MPRIDAWQGESMTIKYKEITKELVREAVADEIILGDGHSIMNPDFYGKHFDVEHLVHTFKSDFSDHKSTLFVNGEPVEELKGIYNLVFVEWLAGQIGLTWRDYGSYGGRGFQAQAIVRTIEKWANSDDFHFVSQEEYDVEQQRKREERAEAIREANPDLFEDSDNG
jgi:hypothetical protein